MEVIGGIVIAFLILFLFIVGEEILEFILGVVLGLVVPIGVLIFSFQLIRGSNQLVGGLLIGAVIIWWFFVYTIIKNR